MPKKPIALLVVERGLVDVPKWNDGRRAHNWAATVTADPNHPGGKKGRFVRGR
jgi:hypothetical protein